MVVNNFFGHWIKDIDIRRYPVTQEFYQQIIAPMFINIQLNN